MLKLQYPFSMICCGSSGCGKSYFVQKLLENWRDTVDTPLDKIIWCYSDKNAIPDLKTDCNVEFFDGIPVNFSHPENDGLKTIYIIDDLMLDIEKNKQVCELFTRDVHHLGICVILLLQNFFVKGNYARTISLNSKYICAFKSPRDVSQFNHLAYQVWPDNPRALIKIYKESTFSPHSYLFLDLSQSINEALRFRTDIFNKEYSTCFVPSQYLKTEYGFKAETIAGKSLYSLCS
jgi:hypothetical protein